MHRLLIIGFGNPLRSDDGVAWRAVEALQKKFPNDEVEILCLHQLVPEMAESVSGSGCVIFIDAAAAPGPPGEIKIEELQPAARRHANAPAFGHVLSPQAILGLALQLYGSTPRSFCATVTGANFEHGESLSPPVAAALPGLINRIRTLIEWPRQSERRLNV
jgi:hydrogenase maturation protease